MNHSEEDIQALRDALTRARQTLYADLRAHRDIIRREYSTGSPQVIGDLTAYQLDNPPGQVRRALGGGIRSDIYAARSNLFQSTVQTITAATFPATPTIRVEPLGDALQGEIEDQNDFLNHVIIPSGLDKAMEKAISGCILSAWAGVKCLLDFTKDKPLHERVTFIPVDALACGWEPHHRRFKWHSYRDQAANVPKERWPDAEKIDPHQILSVTECYVSKFGNIEDATVYFAELTDGSGKHPRDADDAKQEVPLGEATHSEKSFGDCLQIFHFLEPAPGIDIPQPECLIWAPVSYSLNRIAEKIDSEIGRLNSSYVYDSRRVRKDDVEGAIGRPGNIASCIAVRISGDAELGSDEGLRGVDSAVRPVEHQTILSELIAAWHQKFTVWQVITGVNELQRGEIPGGRQTATEIQTASNNSELRAARRREQVTDAITGLAKYLLKNQRKVFGEGINIRGRIVAVPDPKKIAFSLRIDPVELGHLTKRGDFQNQVAGHQLIVQTFGQFPAGAPPAVVESTRRTLATLGWRDLDAFLPVKLTNDSPEDRIQNMLLRGTPIPVHPDDQHDAFFAAYDRWIRLHGDLGPSHPALLEVQNAMTEHRKFAAASRIPAQGGGGADPALQGQAFGNSVPGSGLAPLGGPVAAGIAQEAASGIADIR